MTSTEADVILVNTCCFINDAKEESVNTILEMAELQKERNLQGALSSAAVWHSATSRRSCEEMPEVDGILGTTSYDEVSKVLAEALKERAGHLISTI